MNIYIKKYYGQTDIYECEFNSERIINQRGFSLLTKPISFCDNKKSIFNKLYNFEGEKLISGYLGLNSYFDIYLDIIDNTNIKTSIMPSFLSTYYTSFNNLAKYLKKNIEYNLDFYVDHLIKLEPGFNANVFIYNSYKNITINSTFPTAHLKGYSFKIKSNNEDAMVYFYEKLKQIIIQTKIESEKGKNIEIKLKYKYSYIVDFGFEGYNPVNLEYYNIKYGNTIFIENIYDKLKTELVENEYLYFYLFRTNDFNYDHIEIKYSENLNNPNNDYSFNVIRKNEENKTLIINNINKIKIKYHINFCEYPHNVSMFYQSGKSENEKLYIFNNENRTTSKLIDKNNDLKLRFKSEEDFIFSYSFIDNADILAKRNKTWKKEREVLTNLYIENISIKKINDEFSNIISIKFYPNYKASSTRYIIVIIPKTNNNTFDIISNPCHITRLVTEKNKDIKIINLFDTGENGLINVDVDISDLLSISNKFFINIISQELRFDKELHFYTPRQFDFIEEKTIEINIDNENIFDFKKQKTYFNLSYTKLSKINEMFLLYYKLEKIIPIIIRIYHPDGKKESFNIDKLEGYINFLCDKNGSYKIEFEREEINNLKNDNNDVK